VPAAVAAVAALRAPVPLPGAVVAAALRASVPERGAGQTPA
jgi:hypothetical protein